MTSLIVPERSHTVTEEVADEDQPKQRYTATYLGNMMHAGYVGHVIEEMLDETMADLQANLAMTKKLIRYFAGTYYTDCQRRQAERELFRLQTERSELEMRIDNTLTMVPELLHPVTVTHT